MLSCFSSINSYFDQWHVQKQGLKMTHSSIVKQNQNNCRRKNCRSSHLLRKSIQWLIVYFQNIVNLLTRFAQWFQLNAPYPIHSIIPSKRKLSASVSVSANISAETDTEMSVSAVFRSFGIGRNFGSSRYRNFGRCIQIFLQKQTKNKRRFKQRHFKKGKKNHFWYF